MIKAFRGGNGFWRTRGGPTSTYHEIRLMGRYGRWRVDSVVEGPRTWLPGLHGVEGRRALAEALLELFQRWGISASNQADLLGMEDISPLQLGPLPDNPEVMERAGHILAIARALRRLYPYRPASRDRWIGEPQVALMRLSPLDVMLTRGLKGIKQIRRSLERRLQGAR